MQDLNYYSYNMLMKTFKRMFGLIIVILLGIYVFTIIGKKSKDNRGFDDKAAWTGHTEKLKFLEKKLQSLSDEIKKRVGEGECEYDHECHVVGLGIKTCDGYNNFLVYSTKDAPEYELLTLVEEFNSTSNDFNELSINVPNCGNKPKTPYCENKRCTVGK